MTPKGLTTCTSHNVSSVKLKDRHISHQDMAMEVGEEIALMLMNEVNGWGEGVVGRGYPTVSG